MRYQICLREFIRLLAFNHNDTNGSISVGLISFGKRLTTGVGRLETSIDPKGTTTKNWYDDLGRTTYVSSNWKNFTDWRK